jgi:high-affinity nickel-transport protein
MTRRPGIAPRGARAHYRLDRRDAQTLAIMAAVVIALHLLGFFTLILLVVPRHYGPSPGSGGTFSVGIGLTAYTLGMRHAFDADHIAAIDNTTRKLAGDGKRSTSVGLFFSLGHSTVVFLLALGFALGIRSLSGPVVRPGSTLHAVSSWIGTGVSGAFLYLIAVLNLFALLGILRVFRQMRRGTYDDSDFERRLSQRGFMNRLFGRLTRAIQAPWQMYPVGVLFGLGFDTATEVALLLLAVGAVGSGLPFYAILSLPILFAAGMSLLDTIDGTFMNFAYGWAMTTPVRKLFYNIAITGLSVAVALVIGTIELVGLVAQKLNARGSFWTWLEQINISALGFIIVGMFVATWVVAALIWRLGRIEERWARA